MSRKPVVALMVSLYISQDDAGVDYAAMRRSSGFAEYSALAEDLGDGDVDLGAMSETGARAHRSPATAYSRASV